MTAYPPPNPPQGSPQFGASQAGPGHTSGASYPGQPYPGQPYPGAPQGYAYPGVPTPEERSMAVLAHLSMIIASLLSAGTLAIVGPLVMWLIYKDRSPFVRQAAAGAFNFSIWTAVATWISIILMITIVGAVVGVPLWIFVVVVSIVFPIIGAVRANRGEAYDYPLTPSILR